MRSYRPTQFCTCQDPEVNLPSSLAICDKFSSLSSRSELSISALVRSLYFASGFLLLLYLWWLSEIYVFFLLKREDTPGQAPVFTLDSQFEKIASFYIESRGILSVQMLARSTVSSRDTLRITAVFGGFLISGGTLNKQGTYLLRVYFLPSPESRSSTL